MKFALLILLSLFSVSCVSVKTEERMPNQASSPLAIRPADHCHKTNIIAQENMRVMYKNNRGDDVTGNVKSNYGVGSVVVKDDHLKSEIKKISDISFVSPCMNNIKEGMHVIYPVKNNGQYFVNVKDPQTGNIFPSHYVGNYFVGDVHEVFVNGMAKIVNDRMKPIFINTKSLGSSAECVDQNCVGKEVRFPRTSTENSDGQIKEVFSNGKVVIADNKSNYLYVRDLSQISLEK